MNIIISLLLVVEVITAFLLVLVILAQKSKDQGLGMAFGSGMGESLFGSRAGNVLTRMTVVLAIIFMISTIVLGMLYAKKGKSGIGSVMDDIAATPPPAAQTAQPAALPAAPDDAEPLTLPADDQPQVLQVGEDGQLVPIELPAEATEAAEAVEAAAEEAAEAAPEAAEAVAETAEAAVEAIQEAAPEAAPAEEPAPAAE
ncbi:MAG: preprotein translocase subunit SecG [Kiritimatiellae bacterium]|nr:preprotein translocase subunit SecG [Kiritimatiellia bacterium]